jgi:short-subunit dehydrogenase
MSRIKLKPLNEQVIVITGATSGIGLATARAAAKAGARVMLAGRDEAALKTITVDLNATGAQVDYVIADMRDTAQVQAAADRAIQRYGGFDTWVNNAGGSIYGRFDEVPMEEQQDLFDTNYWGIVRGSTVAVAYLRQHGGALINLGSEVSDIAIPLQSAYVASKHAVKGFTDALRLELIDERAPVSVTLIKPSGIHTLFVEHARNHLDVKPKLPSPLYSPAVVADAILHAAVSPRRSIYVGGAAPGNVAFARLAPRLFDTFMGRLGVRMQSTERRTRGTDAARRSELLERSPHKRYVHESSLYTQAALHPGWTATLTLGAAALGLLAWKRRH